MIRIDPLKMSNTESEVPNKPDFKISNQFFALKNGPVSGRLEASAKILEAIKANGNKDYEFIMIFYKTCLF